MLPSRLYCRFCAEVKPYGEITALTSQEDQQALIEKISLIGISFVDFSNRMLPQTACVTCIELIRVSHEFLLKVKRSQFVLSEICGVEVANGIGYTFPNCEAVKEESDEGEYLQDELLTSFEDSKSLVKVEKYITGESKTFIKDTEVSEHSLPTTDNTTTPRKLKQKLTWATYPWQCAICGTIVESLKALRLHCQNDHLKCFAFKCADCDEQLKGFNEFVAHVRRHRKILRNYCQYCNMKMEDRSHPDSHLAETCNLCGEIFDNQTILSSHLKLYTNFNLEIELRELNWSTYPAVCQFCNLKVINNDVLREHCLEAHKKCFGNQCGDCDVILVSFKEFVEHVTTHRPHMKYICPYCNMQMNHEDLDHIKGHTESLHPCTLCGQIFQQKRQLRDHKRLTLPSPTKSPKKRRKAPLNSTCGVCGMIMKTPASLKAHLRTHTERKRNYTCDRCGKAYYNKGSLDVHHKIHENNVKEACKICHKTFLTVSRLKKHVKTHNLEMPYKCDECKRYFNSKDRLREHVKVHLNIMPFKCEYCSKRFRHKSIMKTHENQHTGARPYSCNLCCMDFANWSNCNKHMKRKHGTTLAKNVMTPHGKLALNPKTGKPDQLFIDNVVKEWSEMMLGRDKGKKLQIGLERQLVCEKTLTLHG